MNATPLELESSDIRAQAKELAASAIGIDAEGPSLFEPEVMLVFARLGCSQFAANRELTGEFN